MSLFASRLRRKQPLIVFVHTPKAAGSTIGAALRAMGSGVEHIEKHRADPEQFLKIARKSDWISGHIMIDVFQELLADLDRPIRYYSAIREPVTHVMSHYNWLIEIHHRGGRFYDNHGPWVKKISETLRATDNSDPEAVIANLRRFKRPFLDCQSRFVLGLNFDAGAGTVANALGVFDYISDGTDLEKLLARISPKAQSSSRSNVSTYHFDRSVFAHPSVVEFLSDGNARDIELYQAVQAFDFDERTGA